MSRTGTVVTAAVVVLGGFGAVLGWSASQHSNEAIAVALTRGHDPTRGPRLIRHFGCGGCHTIAGVNGADGKVAAPLDELRKRVYIGGGVIRNTPENLVHWIVSPRSFAPRTAMPETGISEAEARDLAAFLYAH